MWSGFENRDVWWHAFARLCTPHVIFRFFCEGKWNSVGEDVTWLIMLPLAHLLNVYCALVLCHLKRTGGYLKRVTLPTALPILSML